MKARNREMLFQEHWRRFYDLPQQGDSRTDIVAEALFWNDQIAWSLGIIPWRAWRYPLHPRVEKIAKPLSTRVAKGFERWSPLFGQILSVS